MPNALQHICKVLYAVTNARTVELENAACFTEHAPSLIRFIQNFYDVIVSNTVQ